MKLSIIIPSFNEGGTILTVIKRLQAVDLQSVKKEIIVVDDGSTDNTRKKLTKISGVTKVFLKQNRGKGAAIRVGLNKISGDYILIQDADLEYDPEDIKLMLKPVLEGKAAVVYGTRFLGPHRNMLFWHLMGNKLLSLMTNILFNTTISDMEVCYKLIPAKILKSFKLESNRFGFEPEVTAKLLKTGVRIYEVPISYAGREFSDGKKITWKDGIQAFYLLWKYRFR